MLEEYLEQIREYAGIDIEEYKSDWKAQRVVERTLQMMIETCTDIAEHIIADARMKPPESYTETFKVLYDNGVIDEDLSSELQRMSKFRNILVHQYEEVDASVVILILQRHLGDFSRFKEAVLDYMGRQP